MTDVQYNVIVLGAGMAGLTAARTLAEAGQRVLLLEARQQVGGRMRTHHAAGLAQPIELGAEFIHGRPPELLALLEEAGLTTYEAEGENFGYRDGQLASDERTHEAWALLDGMESAVAECGDMSFDAYLARLSAPEDQKAQMRNYVEGFNAADAGVIGIAGLARQQAAEDEIEGERAARVVEGYQALAEYVRDRAIAAGATLLPGTPVTSVDWGYEGCTVSAADGRSWSSSKVVCALPLGVLQGSHIAFTPVPDEAERAWQSLSAGVVQRLVLQFTGRWWAEHHPRMHFLFAPEVYPPTWWTTAPRESPLMTGWAGGPRCRSAEDLDAYARDAVRSLEHIFGIPLGVLFVAAHLHDWQADRFSLGAYSYAPAGAADAPQILAKPIRETLFFAGEHTDISGHPGTVHGAMRSGLRAARQVLDLQAAATSRLV